MEGAKNPRPFFILANAVEMRGAEEERVEGETRDQDTREADIVRWLDRRCLERK